jgi:sodium-dependent dicarboxylate transporter 2/3/5
MLGIAYASSIGGVATIIGTPPNVFLVGFIKNTIEPAYRQDIGFGQWMLIGVPLVLIFLPLTWLLLTRVLYPLRLQEIEGGREFLQRAYRELGPMNRGELITLIVFMSAAALWIARPWLTSLQLGEGEHAVRPFSQLSDAGIAMTAALALFAIPVTWRTRTFTMDWQHASKLPWGILILFGGGLSLAAAIEANGVAEFIGNQTARFGWLPSIALIVIVTAAVVFFSELASNTATATTLIPILAAMAPGLGTHPYLLIVAATLAASCAFMMPVGTPPNAIVFGTGHVTMAQMIKAGFWLNLIGIVLITALCHLLVLTVLT